MPASCISNKESLVVQRIQWDNLENEEIFEFIFIKIFMTGRKSFIDNFENFEGLFEVRNVWIDTKTSTHWYDCINGRVWNWTFFISKFIEIMCGFFSNFFIQYKVFLLSAFVIFFILRNMRCWRNQIHWNLITSLIMQTASWFILNRFLTLGSGFKTRSQVRK